VSRSDHQPQSPPLTRHAAYLSLDPTQLQRCSCPAPHRKGYSPHVESTSTPTLAVSVPGPDRVGDWSDLESLGYILLSFLAPLPWAPLARQMDVQYVRDGCRMTPIVKDLLRRIELSKEGYIRSIQGRRGGDMRRAEEAVSASIRVPTSQVLSPDRQSVCAQLAAYFRRVSALAFEERPDYRSATACPDAIVLPSY
jgi:hypothetical protein